MDGSTEPCPLKECTALIYCIDGRYMPVKDIDARIVGGPASKPTDAGGTAEFEHLKPPNQDYTAKVTLTGENLNKYIWRDTDQVSAELTQYIAGADTEMYKFRLICLARPKITVQWHAENTAIENVGVKLRQQATDKYTLSNTDASGIAKLAEDAKGVTPGAYTVAFPSGIDHCVVVEDPAIAIEEASAETYLFHIKKFFVSFQLKDQFGEPVTSVDWILYYPDGQKKDSGTFADTSTVKKDLVPDGEYKFGVKLAFAPAWEYKPLEIGKDVKLSASLTGLDPETEVTFDIYDACVPTGAALDTVKGKTGSDVGDPVVQVVWKPDAEKLKKVSSGAVLFIASAGGLKTISEAAAISGKQTFDVAGADGGPLETTVDFSFSGGGKTTEVSVTSTGGKAEPLVPLGATLLSVKLGAHKGSRAKFTDSASSAQSFIAP